ncbi:MAG: methylenetetrahydrofolate reductase [Candidatus Omnitrophica bacterium]|nr:methylenetetrahydrofolate reductase [Candidatus Omnitrophota bacterium]
MKKISDIFNLKDKTISFEIFPPKTDQGKVSLEEALKEFALLEPDFISVTYGAGGSSREKTLFIARLIQERYNIPALHHFTCVTHTKQEISGILDHLKGLGICNILALRGDPPQENPDWTPGPDNFRYSSELVRLIRDDYGTFFSIGMAGFPDGHPLAPSKEFDAEVVQKKIEAGGQFVITQLFFDPMVYIDYVKRLRANRIMLRVIPGILPITNYESVVKFCKNCGASIPQKVHDIFAPIAGDKDKTLAAGIEFAVRQCRTLLAFGAPGLHFYTLNKLEPVSTILEKLNLRVKPVKKPLPSFKKLDGKTWG